MSVAAPKGGGADCVSAQWAVDHLRLGWSVALVPYKSVGQYALGGVDASSVGILLPTSIGN